MDQDVQSYMTEDHFEVSEQIKKLLDRRDKLQQEVLEEISRRIRVHIFIEETVLFPELPESTKNDIDYLEMEHGKILATLDTVKRSNDIEHLWEILNDLYNILVEHNSYEESFVYDHFEGEDIGKIRGNKGPPIGWQSVYERTFL